MNVFVMLSAASMKKVITIKVAKKKLLKEKFLGHFGLIYLDFPNFKASMAQCWEEPWQLEPKKLLFALLDMQIIR